jgi:hypothetical protein
VKKPALFYARRPPKDLQGGPGQCPAVSGLITKPGFSLQFNKNFIRNLIKVSYFAV